MPAAIRKPPQHHGHEFMEETVNSLRALGITEFEGKVDGWGEVSFTLGAVPEWWPKTVLEFLNEAHVSGLPPGAILSQLHEWLKDLEP